MTRDERSASCRTTPNAMSCPPRTQRLYFTNQLADLHTRSRQPLPQKRQAALLGKQVHEHRVGEAGAG